MFKQVFTVAFAVAALCGCDPEQPSTSAASDVTDSTMTAPDSAGRSTPPKGGSILLIDESGDDTDRAGSHSPDATANAAGRAGGAHAESSSEQVQPTAGTPSMGGHLADLDESESLSGGTGLNAPNFVPEPVDGCAPSRDRFDEEIGQHFEQYCGLCHSTSLAFGAPYTLTEYNGLFDAVGDQRVLDLAIAELSTGMMPPAGHMRPGTQVREDILDWATCGSWRNGTDLLPNPGADFDVDREILNDLGEPPDDSDFFELRANEFVVPPNVDDHYECFRFAAPVDEPRFIRRIETLIDDVRVLHHVVLVPDDAGEPNTSSPCDVINPSSLTYAWAPGQGALQFPEGGIRLEPGQRLTLNIHYNNTARHPDVRDSSGVRIYHSAIEGPEVAMLTFGPLDIRVPAGENGSATGWCRIPSDTNLLYSFPHMHDAGTGFSQVLENDDESETDIINISGWDFDAQYIYETPQALPEGSVIRTQCTYRNTTDSTIRFGENTRDEMCFNFSYISPPIGVAACNQAERPRPLTYEAGQCSANGANEVTLAPVNAPIQQGEAPPLMGGPAPNGLWALNRATLYLPQDMIGPFSLDRDRSVVNAIGTVGVFDGRLFFDGVAQLAVVAGPLSTNLTQALSFGGPVMFGAAGGSRLDLMVQCGDLGVSAELQYEFDGDTLTILAPIQEGPLRLDLLLEYTPAQ